VVGHRSLDDKSVFGNFGGLPRLALCFSPPGHPEHQCHPDADATIRDVESRETNFPSIRAFYEEVDEINHMLAAGHEPVGQVADDAPEDQSKGNLAGEGLGLEMMTRQEEDQQGNQRDDGQS
jgi:hypothetical protein